MAIFIAISLRWRSQAILSLLQLASVARDLHFGKEGSRVKVISESLFSEQYLDHLFYFQLFLSPLCPTDIAAVGEDGKAEEGFWFQKGCEQKKKNYQDFHSGFFYFSWTCQTHQLWWLKWGSQKNLRMTASHWSTLDQLRNHLLRSYWQCRWSKFKC